MQRIGGRGLSATTRTRRSRVAAASVAACLAAAVLASCGPAVPTAAEAPEWFLALPAADPARFPELDDPQARKLRLGGDTRNATAAASPPERVLELVVPADARLEIAGGVACPRDGDCASRHRFRVEVAPVGETARTVVDWTLAESSRAWRVETLDLAPYAGRRVRLTASVSPADPASEPPDDALPVWGEPRLLVLDPEPPPNVLLISVDTLRADHLGCHGHERPTSPNLDALAGEGIRFAHAVSSAGWTTPAHISLLTSLHPSTHRVDQSWKELDAFQRGRGSYRVLRDEALTLAEILRERGYSTLAVTGSGTVAAEIGFAQGFDLYAHTANFVDPALGARLRSLLVDHQDSPFFLFFHTFEIHEPYRRPRFVAPMLPEGVRNRLEALIQEDPPELQKRIYALLEENGLNRAEIVSALYDGGVRFADDFLGSLFAELRGLGLLDRTLVVVTSDHGEEFADHSEVLGGHGHSLYDEMVRIPLILRLPSRIPAGQVLETPVSTVDVAPTILDLLQIEVPEAMQGRSLVPLWVEGGSPDTAEANPVLSEATIDSLEWKSVRHQQYKYLLRFPTIGGDRRAVPSVPPWEVLFDVGSDPGEKTNLAGDQPTKLREMRQLLKARIRSYAARSSDEAPTLELDPELREQLQGLGYLE